MVASEGLMGVSERAQISLGGGVGKRLETKFCDVGEGCLFTLWTYFEGIRGGGGTDFPLMSSVK